MNYEIAKTSLGPVSYRRLGSGQRKILFFHGFPGSSTQIGIFKSEIDILGLEVICFDRPGYNQTEIKTQDSLRDSLIIAQELLSKFSWTHFEIVTVSGGTPFGVYYALKHPEKVVSLRVICGLGNFNVPAVRKSFSKMSILALRLLPQVPGAFLKKALNGSRTNGRNPLITFFLPASQPDQAMFQEPSVFSSLNRALSEALVQDALGPKQDAKAFLSNWSQGSEKLLIPIHFWHGDKDHVISSKICDAMYPQFPKSGMTLVKGEGHISLPVVQIGKILNFKFVDQK